jgi:hypothetical protein
MADEITVSATVIYNKNGKRRSIVYGSTAFDISANTYTDVMQSIAGTTGEAVLMGEVTAPKWAVLRNASSTKYLKVGTKDGAGPFVPFANLPPGGVFIGPLDELTITGTNVLFAIPEDATAVLLDGVVTGA